MTFVSKATTAEELRQQLVDDLQRRAERAFVDLRRLRDKPAGQRRRIIQLEAEFSTICFIRDFYKEILVGGKTSTPISECCHENRA